MTTIWTLRFGESASNAFLYALSETSLSPWGYVQMLRSPERFGRGVGSGVGAGVSPGFTVSAAVGAGGGVSTGAPVADPPCGPQAARSSPTTAALTVKPGETP